MVKMMNRYDLDKEMADLKEKGFNEDEIYAILECDGYWKRVDGVDEKGNPHTYNIFVPRK